MCHFYINVPCSDIFMKNAKYRRSISIKWFEEKHLFSFLGYFFIGILRTIFLSRFIWNIQISLFFKVLSLMYDIIYLSSFFDVEIVETISMMHLAKVL